MYDVCTHTTKGDSNMKKNMDCIKFEYRSEIDEIETALDCYLKDHPSADNKETVKEMIHLLDVMYMSW